VDQQEAPVRKADQPFMYPKIINFTLLGEDTPVEYAINLLTMKKITFLCLLLFSGFSLFGQNASETTHSHIVFRIHDAAKDHVISIYEPLDGAYNFLVPSTIGFKETATDSCFTYTYTNTYPAFILVKIDNRRFHILLFANNFITVDIYPNVNSPAWIKFSGTNAAGQKWYNDWTFIPWERFQTIDKIFDIGHTHYSKIYDDLNNYFYKIIYSIDSMRYQNRISSSFDTMMRKDIYFTIYGEAVKNYDIILSGKKYGRLSHDDSIVIMNIQKKIYSIFSPFTPNILTSINGQSYMASYIQYDKKETSSLLNKPYPFEINNRYYNSYAILPPKYQESFWGMAIVVQFLYDQHEFNKEEAFRFFRKKFPKSQYIPAIEALKKEHSASKKNYQPDNDIHIDTTSTAMKLHSIKDLHEKYFSGKKVFIDIWATWCMPCRSEFAYKNELDSVAKQHNITLVFLSIDQLSFLNKWIDDINYFKLKGYHFLVNNILMNDIKENIYNDQPVTIPRYILMNEKGDIINKDAPRPSEIRAIEKLFSAQDNNNSTKSRNE